MVRRFSRHFVISALIILVVDQVTKFLVDFLRPQFKASFLQLHYITNTGAGFGILKGNSFLLGVISLLVGLLILWKYEDFPKRKEIQTVLGIFLGGVFGNMIDRFLRRYVIDFIDVGFWPAFNIADAAISISVVLLLIYSWREK